jgi:hypothetical protein
VLAKKPGKGSSQGVRFQFENIIFSIKIQNIYSIIWNVKKDCILAEIFK